MAKLIDRTGHVYGRLTVVERFIPALPSRSGRTLWLCQCECGNMPIVTGHSLACGDIVSCGCYRKERFAGLHTTHGTSRTRTYRAWMATKMACHNPKDKQYKSYGARGIKISPEWKDSFATFLADMGERPDGMTLGRIDLSRDFSSQNCRWVAERARPSLIPRNRKRGTENGV